MKVEFDMSNENEIPLEDLLEEENPHDVVEAFFDTGNGNVYIASDDCELGPYWTEISEAGYFKAYASRNLPIVGPCYEIDPKIIIVWNGGNA